MSYYVQVCGCFNNEDNDVIPFVPDYAAEYYGVYVGEREMTWVADFKYKQYALEYAQLLSNRHGYTVDNRTFASRES